MGHLVGFVPKIELEMRFTGLELLHLLAAAKHHYDGRCKETAMHAGNGRVNGTLIRAMMHLGGAYGCYLDRGNISDEEFLAQNLSAETIITLTWREVDTLCKVSEQFNLMGRFMVHEGLFFNMDVAARIASGLHRALNEAQLNLDVLHEQEKMRRKSALDASPDRAGS